MMTTQSDYKSSYIICGEYKISGYAFVGESLIVQEILEQSTKFLGKIFHHYFPIDISLEL